MDFINQKDNPDLRDIDVMIAYLKDEVSLEEVERIENLMEEDELYNLSMQQLSRSLGKNTNVLRNRVVETQKEFPQLLILARDQFVAQLEQKGPENNSKSLFGGVQLWQMIIALLIVGGALAWFIFFPLKPVNLHQDPAIHLVLDGDVSVANTFLQECGDQNPGIGRTGRISLYSALVENYALEKYEEAQKQFEELRKNPGWTGPCKAYLSFYQGKALLALKQYNSAADLFQEVIASANASPPVKYATHWYLANIFLIRKDYHAARTHLESLIADDIQDEGLHIETLFKQNYLQTAKQYYMDISGS